MNKILKNSIPYLFFVPILFNAVYNLLKSVIDNELQNINLYDYMSSILLFLFLFSVGNLIKISLNLRSFSFSIIVFLLSFFVLDTITLFFNKTITFNQNFLFGNMIWIIFFLYKRKYLETTISLFAYSILNFFNIQNFDKLNKDINIVGDVEALFYPQSQNIFENSYYFSVTNFIAEGYPQFTSYIQALLVQFSLSVENFVYISSSTQVIFLFSILFFLELKISKSNKVYLIALFTSLIFNSKWLQFMFTSSLMSEGIVSLFSAIIIYETFNAKKNIPLTFTALGMLYFTKQFLSSITIILVIFMLFKSKYKKYAFLGFSGLALKETLFAIIFPSISSSLHLSQINIFMTFKEIVTFTNLKIVNIYYIGKNIWLDKPLTLLIFGLFVLYFLTYFSEKILSLQIKVYGSIVFLNLISILLLYISVWQNMELESPIRFIWSFLHLKLVLLGIISETYQPKENP